MKRQHTLAALSAAVLTVAGTGLSAYGQDDPWKFSLAVPLQATSIDGNVTLLGHSAPVDISFNKLRDHIDAALGLGFEARTRRYGFYSGFSYMKLTAQDNFIYDRLQFAIVEGGAFYRFVEVPGDHPFVLEGVAGLRYFYTKNELTIQPVGPFAGFAGSKIRNVADPIIGGRGSVGLFNKCHLDASGDIGGFDINRATDWTWSAAGVVTYDFTKWFSLSAGYKALGLDEKDNAAAQTGFDVVFKGPIIVGKFTF